ncbi:aminotransferase class I/II-fold pyridoxal phosphate-dependent enzyme [archaeon]|nr:MAG: aminotransferase class I/II-fold pyridoxal phosphate-dependent enzyme [archaeon]
MATTSATRIDISTISPLVKAASYAVRGRIVARSAHLAEQLKKDPASLPFKKIVPCNIGNPHSLGQLPLSFSRDVLSLVLNPSLKSRAAFSEDVITRADNYLRGIPGVGAYTESQGILAVRQDVSQFLQERDGYASDPADIFLTNGASEGVKHVMQLLLRDPSTGFRDGLLIPIPQYPLYSALTTLLQGELLPYYLREETGWSCSVGEIRQAIAQAKQQSITPRALVVINPGNPTGQVLSKDNMKQIVSLCVEEGVCLMADEVYQENIWKPDAKFTSFRKVAYEMGIKPSSGDLQMFSFHSISKGFYGECGLRGGYLEIFGIPNEVKDELYKLASISLCSNTIGQIATGLMVQPPKTGEPSYSTYVKERDGILQSMKRRAELLNKELNSVEGMKCASSEGAMYAFPTIRLPRKCA